MKHRGGPISGLRACIVLARLSAVRGVRSKSFWIAVGFTALPILAALGFAASDQNLEERWKAMVAVLNGFIALVAPVLLAPAVAEEVSDQTYTYLWSRPFPRWAVLAGKSLAGLFLAALVVLASTGISFITLEVGDPALFAEAAVGLLAGVAAVGITSACIGTLMPKHPLSLSLAFFLIVNVPISVLPLSFAKLSVLHHSLQLAGAQDHVPGWESALWLVGLTGIWLLLAVRRIERKELSAAAE
jgi:ABC-type transport system involved in multi-copper enzyme maturation permease subunit